MFHNITPFVCSNQKEFEDDRRYLKDNIYPKIKRELSNFSIFFDPIQIEWNERDDYVRNGYLIRLLLNNIEKASPFFICLLGYQYGPYLEKPIIEVDAMSWLAKNLLVASQTGYEKVINPSTLQNSLIEHQINAALSNQNNYPMYRFYFRQMEYFDEKFVQLSIERRKEETKKYLAENEHCEAKIKELKMSLAKKGLQIKYYKTVEQLGTYVYEDLIDLIKTCIKLNPSIGKTRLEWKTDIFVSNKLNKFLLTDSIKVLFKSLDEFVRSKSHSVHFDLETKKSKKNFTPTSEMLVKSDQRNEVKINMDDEDNFEHEDNEDYLEVLKLRHVNLVSVNGLKSSNQRNSASKQIFMIVGPRAKGKSTLMAKLYEYYVLGRSFDKIRPSILSNDSNYSIKSSTNFSSQQTRQSDTFFLFYFLKPDDYLINVLVDVTHKMRSKYGNKDSTFGLNQELHDKRSIIDQFHASLCMGPVIIFIDGLTELNANHSIKLNTWLPNKLDNNCKFVFTVTKSSEYYSELNARKVSTSYELNLFSEENDYRLIFGKYLGLDDEQMDNLNHNLSNNVLFGKFLSYLHELKTADHINNPVYIQIIAQELFSFDKEIYKTHPVYSNRKNSASNLAQLDSQHQNLLRSTFVTQSVSSKQTNSSSNLSASPVNIINSYIEEVSTIREIIQKIIKRNLKKNNWSVNSSTSVSVDNPGWMGDVLCLIALSKHGLGKDSAKRILKLKGYKGKQKVNELNWHIFRMQFGDFIQDGLNGTMHFSHDYFKEAVQTLLLEGFSISIENRSDLSVQLCKKNIGDKQKELHTFLIVDIIKYQLQKSDFDSLAQVKAHKSIEFDIKLDRYVEIFHELIYHLYMVFDLINLCKVLTNFKVLQLFYDNRMRNLSRWFDFCEYFKMTTNSDILRSVLLSSFTIGLPDFVFELKDNTLNLRKCNEQELGEYFNNKIEYAEVKAFLNHQTTDMDNILKKNSQSALSTSEKEPEIADFYEKLIDDLLDLTDAIDLTKSAYGDTLSIIVVNRALILNDLMKQLDDKYFLEYLSLPLFQLTFEIVTRNFPLDDTEKLKYTFVLQVLAKLSLQTNEFDLALKYLIKSIEMAEDLLSTFLMSNLNIRYKNRMEYLRLSNRISVLHSSMALILLKMKNVNAAHILVQKASEFISEKSYEKIKARKFKSECKEDEESKNNQSKDNLYWFRETIVDIYKAKQKRNETLDDASSIEAKYFYLLVSGLIELQSGSYELANRRFASALDISLEWFGANHTNTSKVYHYQGCFFSIENTSFSNPRRAELYLRKALYIRQQPSTTASDKTSNFLSSAMNTFAVDTYRSLTDRSSESSYRDSTLNYSTSSYEDLKANPNSKLIVNEDPNAVAEILFDLGCLLATFESSLSKRESVDCLRRCLDLKVLIFGPNYIDCQMIKKKMGEILLENAQHLNKTMNKSEKIREQAVTSRLSGISRPQSGFTDISPKKAIEMLKKQNQLDAKSNQSNLLNEWIRKNSIIEIIPNKKDRKKQQGSDSDEQKFQIEQSILLLENDSIIQTNSNTIENYTSTNILQAPDPTLSMSIVPPESTQKAPATSFTTIAKANEQKAQEVKINELKLPRSMSVTSQRNKQVHSRTCRCPTALSVDVHNSKNISGPNSDLNTLVKLNANQDVKSKVVKHVYYKSAWYDAPPGTNKRRFKTYLKLTPNA